MGVMPTLLFRTVWCRRDKHEPLTQMGSGLASWRQCHLLRLPEEGAEPGEAGAEGPGPRRQLGDWSQC